MTGDDLLPLSGISRTDTTSSSYLDSNILYRHVQPGYTAGCKVLELLPHLLGSDCSIRTHRYPDLRLDRTPGVCISVTRTSMSTPLASGTSVVSALPCIHFPAACQLLLHRCTAGHSIRSACQGAHPRGWIRLAVFPFSSPERTSPPT